MNKHRINIVLKEQISNMTVNSQSIKDRDIKFGERFINEIFRQNNPRDAIVTIEASGEYEAKYLLILYLAEFNTSYPYYEFKIQARDIITKKVYSITERVDE